MDTTDSVLNRAKSLNILILIIGAIFIGRLFYLQVVKYDFYQEQALSEHQTKFSIPALRGTISAKNGEIVTPLVLNQTLQTIWADPQGIKDAETTAGLLAPILKEDAKKIQQKLIAPNSRYQVLARKLDEETAQSIKDLDLRGIGFSDVIYRIYPEKSLGSQILGFVNNDGLGQYGVEEFLQDQLDGEEGRLKAVTDVHGIPLPTIESNIVEKPVDGDDLVLTIDVNAQSYVETAVKDAVMKTRADSGSAIVMNPNTGAVVAMANYPTYDPTNLGKVDDFSVFLNEVVSSAYEPGSGMKVLTMATGLSEGVISKNSTYTDNGSIVVEDTRINNAVDGTGVRKMTEVIQKSINTGVVHVLEKLGGGEVNKKARDTLFNSFTNIFQLGAETGIEQSNEATGRLFSPDEGTAPNVRYANMSFGQGMTVSMVQLASAISSVVNGGTYYQPYLVDSAIAANGEETKTIPKVIAAEVVSPSISRDLIEMMQLVVEDGGGRTAQRDGYVIGGKTGTAQVPDENGQYSKDETIGSFVGFLGSDSPEYVVMTRINNPKTAGFAGTEVAAPLFTSISNWLIGYYQIPPQ